MPEILIAILVIVAIVILLSIKIVPQAQSYVIERLGSYYATWQNGLHFQIPLLQRIAKKVSLKEQVADFPPCDPAADGQADRPPYVQRDHHTGERYITFPHHRASGGHLGGTVFPEGKSGDRRRDLAAVLYSSVLSDL